jgi:sporulation protein YabP
MAENALPLPHRLSLDERKKLNLTGAREVIHFDEELVELDTVQGNLVIQGSELRLKCLSLEDGNLVIQGHISGILYDEPKQKRGFFR